MGIRKGAVIDWAPNPASHKRAMSEAADASMAYRNDKMQQTLYRDRRDR